MPRVYLESTPLAHAPLQPQGKCKKTNYRIDGANENLHPEVGQPYVFALSYDVSCLLLVLLQYTKSAARSFLAADSFFNELLFIRIVNY